MSSIIHVHIQREVLIRLHGMFVNVHRHVNRECEKHYLIWYEHFFGSDLSANLENIRQNKKFWKTCKCAIFFQCVKHMNGDVQLIRFFRIMHRSILSFHSLFKDNGTKIDCFHLIPKRLCIWYMNWLNELELVHSNSFLIVTRSNVS